MQYFHIYLQQDGKIVLNLAVTYKIPYTNGTGYFINSIKTNLYIYIRLFRELSRKNIDFKFFEIDENRKFKTSVAKFNQFNGILKK